VALHPVGVMVFNRLIVAAHNLIIIISTHIGLLSMVDLSLFKQYLELETELMNLADLPPTTLPFFIEKKSD
jgi:hypothetical protein